MSRDARSQGQPPAFDTSVAHIARVYNYWLGGKDNYAADREVGEQALSAYPDIVASVRANRAFLIRTVRYLAGEAGIRQFLDIGTGIPTANNTHEVAQSAAPDSRVVYVDNDPVVLAHARALLTSSPQGTTAYIDADLRDPSAILDQTAETLDFSRPIGVMLVSVLHCIPEAAQPREVVARLIGATAPGSFVTISHPASDIESAAAGEAARRFNMGAAAHVTLRSRDDVLRFFDGLDLVPPGLVRAQDWRPESDAQARRESTLWAGVGRRP